MYLTIVRTPYNPEAEDAGELRVFHMPVPRPKLVKGGTARNERIKRQTFEPFVAEGLVDHACLPASYAQAVVDWLMTADLGDNMNLPPFGGCDGAVLVLMDEGEPTNYTVRQEPAFSLVNSADLDDDDDEEDDSEEDDEEDDPGENRTYLEDDDDEEERPRKPTKSKPPKKRPR